jgi:SagB-type dehydrogenase family enzyme
MHVALELKPSVTPLLVPPGEIRLTAGPREVLKMADQPRCVMDAVATLARGGVSEDGLNERMLDAGGLDALLRWQHVLALCLDENLIDYRIVAEGRWIATIEPLVPGVEPPAPPGTLTEARRLSRFAYLRRDGDRIVLESPPAPVRIALAPEAVIAVCAAGHPAPAWSSVASNLTRDDATSWLVLALLDRWQFLEPVPSDEGPAASTWEFHDALFHRASRPGRGRPAGATFRMRDRLPAWPAVKARGAGTRVALERPDMAAVAAADPPLSEVAGRRRSIRTGGTVLSLAELSEVLFRALHVRSLERGERVDTIRRAVPAGGGLHELEAYVAVRQCRGLAPGSYWYDAHAHGLETLSRDAGLASAFVDQAARSWGRRFPPPDVLVTLAARVPRVAWQYEAIAYRIILLNVGVVMQMLYLVATAMRLAPCAIGSGDPALFATLTGADPFEETSVGEFALSGRVAAD